MKQIEDSNSTFLFLSLNSCPKILARIDIEFLGSWFFTLLFV